MHICNQYKTLWLFLTVYYIRCFLPFFMDFKSPLSNMNIATLPFFLFMEYPLSASHNESLLGSMQIKLTFSIGHPMLFGAFSPQIFKVITQVCTYCYFIFFSDCLCSSSLLFSFSFSIFLCGLMIFFSVPYGFLSLYFVFIYYKL